MYSIKFAAKLVNIKELCKYIVDKLRIIRVLSTYYLTFRVETLRRQANARSREHNSFFIIL